MTTMTTRGKHTETEKAYAAALIDGEGHIIIYKDNRQLKKGSKQKNPTYILIVGCTNTELSIVDFLYQRWGACRQLRSRQRENWKPVYSWTIQSKMAWDFLQDILPYLTAKKWKAELAISFQEGMERIKNDKGKFLPLAPEELERREEIWKKLNLHRKGIRSRRD